MSSLKKTNYSYVGIALILLVFGIIFIPKIVDRIKHRDISRNDRMSQGQDNNFSDDSELTYIEIEGESKKVPSFNFVNQNGDSISNKDYLGKVYVVEFFFTTCPSICPIMNRNLIQIQDSFKSFEDFGVASFTINPEYDTQEVLKAYADQYGVSNPNWNMMTGEKEDIYALANTGFNLFVDVENFEHSGNFALIDKKGFLRSRRDEFGNPIIFYKGTITEQEKVNDEGEKEEISILKEDIKKLLNE